MVMDPKIQNLNARIKNVQLKMSRLMDDTHAAREAIQERLAEIISSDYCFFKTVTKNDVIVSQIPCKKSPAGVHVFTFSGTKCTFCKWDAK